MASFNINRICCLLLLVLVEWTVPQNGKFYYFFFNSVCCATPLSRNLPGGQSEQLYETCSDRCVHIVYVMKHSDMFVFCNICYFVMKRQQCISPRVLSLSTRTSYPVNPYNIGYIPLPPPKTEE